MANEPLAAAPGGDPARLEIQGAVATLTLDRPAVLNAIDVPMARCLADLAERVASLPEVRVLVLRGAGRAFCGGGDIGAFAAAMGELAPVIREILLHMHRFLVSLRAMPKLVVTSVHGAAAGAGFSLAFMGDLCVAAHDARFRPAYADLGVSPDCGGTVGVVDAVGPRRALQLFLAEDVVSAARAEALGLVGRVVPAPDLVAETAALAARLAALAPAAAAETKALVHRSSATPLVEQLEREQASLLRCMAQEAFRTQVTRFVSRGSS